MLGDQRHKAVVGSKLVEDIVGDEKNLFFKILDIRMTQQIRIGSLEYLACLVRNQMISNIVLIFEIKIEGALCNAGVVHDVRNRGFIKAVVDKERESRVQKGLTLHLFVIINFSHRESPFLKDIKSVCHYLVYNYRYHTWKLSKGK